MLSLFSFTSRLKKPKAEAKLKLCIYSNNWVNLYRKTEAQEQRRHGSICILSVSPATVYLCRALGLEWHMVKDSPKKGHWNSFQEGLRSSAAHKGILNEKQDSRSVVLMALSPKDRDHLKFQKKMKAQRMKDQIILNV